MAVERGLYISSSQEGGTMEDILHLFRSIPRLPSTSITSILSTHFNIREDGLFFLVTLTLISLGHYIGGYSEVLTGCDLKTAW